MIFRFETRDVPVPTTRWVGERLGQKRGGWIFGPMGTGKSHAVRMAVRERIWVDVASGPLLSQRFASDLARQLGADGRTLLEAFRSEGIEASLRIADQVMNGHPFVVDGVDALLSGTPSLDDPAVTHWQDEKQVLLAWLRGRLERSPTFLVGRRRPQEVESLESTCAHATPDEWPIRLEETDSGYRNWPTLGKLAKGNPAVLTLARALIPLLPASAFNDLVEQAEDDKATVLGLLQALGEAFRSSAPPSWQRVLALVGAVGEAPRDAIEPLLDGRAGAAPAAPVSTSCRFARDKGASRGASCSTPRWRSTCGRREAPGRRACAGSRRRATRRSPAPRSRRWHVTSPTRRAGSSRPPPRTSARRTYASRGACSRSWTC